MSKQTNCRKLKQSFISPLILVAALAVLSAEGLRADGNQVSKAAGAGGTVPTSQVPAVDKSKAKPVRPPAFDKRAAKSLDGALEQPKKVLGEGPVPAAEQRTRDKSGATPDQLNAINKVTPAQPNDLKK